MYWGCWLKISTTLNPKKNGKTTNLCGSDRNLYFQMLVTVFRWCLMIITCFFAILLSHRYADRICSTSLSVMLFAMPCPTDLLWSCSACYAFQTLSAWTLRLSHMSDLSWVLLSIHGEQVHILQMIGKSREQKQVAMSGFSLVRFYNNWRSYLSPLAKWVAGVSIPSHGFWMFEISSVTSMWSRLPPTLRRWFINAFGDKWLKPIVLLSTSTSHSWSSDFTIILRR